MVKTILKETMIILLLCVAIILILSILFYDYNPTNKVIPNKVAYSVPENIKNELEENVDNTLSIENKVYTIDSSDLNLYKKSDSYTTSKDNPFATTETATSSTSSSSSAVNTNTNTNNSNTNNNNTQNTNTNNNTQNTNTTSGSAKKIK